MFRHVLLAQRGRPASRRTRKVHLDALGRVVVCKFLEDGELGVPDFLVNVAAAFGSDHRPVNPKVRSHSHAGDEVHALVVGAVDQHRERVETPVDEALHVVPHVVVRHLVERLDVGAEPLPNLGRIEQAVPSLDHVDEGVHAGAGHVVDGPPGVLHLHWRVEDEQIEVACVVGVNDSLSLHGVSPS